MWLVKETDPGKSGPTMELYEEQQKKTKCGCTVWCPAGLLLQKKSVSFHLKDDR